MELEEQEDPLASPTFFPTAEWVLRRLEQKHDPHIAQRILNITIWGSRVYGCATPTSDWDCIIVTRFNTAEDMALIAVDPNKMRAASKQSSEQRQPRGKKSISEIDASLFPIYQDAYINATLIPLDEWIVMIREHRHMALEAVYAPPKFKLLEKHPVTIDLDPDILRRTVLWESTRTFVASGNKLLVPGGFTDYNFYRARKEIVHSFRYLLFAIQLVKMGRIDDFGAANPYLRDILQESEPKEREQVSAENPTHEGGEQGSESGTKNSVAGTGRKRGARRGDKENEAVNQRWDAVISRFRPIFEQLRQELKDLRDYSHLYGRYHTEAMLYTSLKDRRKEQSPCESASLHTQAIHKHEVAVDSSLEAIQYLQKHDGSPEAALSALEVEHKITYCRHTKHPNLVLLHVDGYNIRSWDTASQISRECNGLIVDTHRNYQAVAYSFAHISEQSPNQEVDPDILSLWQREGAHLQVTECLDGITAVLYFYAGEWHLSSNFEPDMPTTNLTWKEDDCSIPFHQLFWDAWSACKYQLPEDEDCCYTFEIMSRKHRHLARIPHTEHDALLLVAVRHMPTLNELNPQEIATRYGWASVPFYQHFRSLEEVQAAAREVNPFVCKGFVIVDTSRPTQWRRWVVKSPQYVAVQLGTDLSTVGPLNLRADMDEMHMQELLRYNKAEEFVAYHPRWKDFAQNLRAQHDEMCGRLQEIWVMLLQAPDQREFAALCKRHGGAGHDFIFFKMRKEGRHLYASVRQYLAISEDSIFTKLLHFWDRRPV